MSAVESRPYRWPYHGRVMPAQTVLMVFRDGPAEEGPALGNLARVAEVARSAGSDWRIRSRPARPRCCRSQPATWSSSGLVMGRSTGPTSTWCCGRPG